MNDMNFMNREFHVWMRKKKKPHINIEGVKHLGKHFHRKIINDGVVSFEKGHCQGKGDYFRVTAYPEVLYFSQ